MSHGSSPVHRFSSTYDSFCDPEFTAEISTKMQVPDRISVIGQGDSLPPPPPPPSKSPDFAKLYMHVPDRILVAGDNKHIEGKEVLPELRLERSMLDPPNPVVTLSDPPQMITLGDYNFPTVDEEPSRKAKDVANSNYRNKNHLALDTFQSNIADMSSDLYPPTPPGTTSFRGTTDELSLLQRHLKHLDRRVRDLENETQQRQQREIILYSLGVIYFVLKGIIWLHKHW